MTIGTREHDKMSGETGRGPAGFAKRFQDLNDDLTQTQRQLIQVKKERNELRKKLQQHAPSLKELLSSLHQLLASPASSSAPTNIDHLRAIVDSANQLSPVKAEHPQTNTVEEAMQALNETVKQLHTQQMEAQSTLEAVARVGIDTHEEMLRSLTRAKMAEQGRSAECDDPQCVETELEMDELRLRAMEMESELAHSMTECDALDMLEMANMDKLMIELDGTHRAKQVH